MYKISVVVPTYNTGDFIRDFLFSIKAQTIGFENIEIIFVDDNSSDGYTINLLKALDYNFDNIKSVFLDTNSGFPGTGRNVGLKLASSDYVIFSDHDDTYTPDAFKTMYDWALKEDADLVITNYYRVYENEKIKEKTSFKGEHVVISNVEDDLRFFEMGPSIWTKLFKRSFLNENNMKFLEKMLAEDMEMYINALFKSKKTVYLDDFYSYNYSIRNVEGNMSTIHIRNKKYLEGMINGYFEIDKLLNRLNKDDYYSNIFKKHFVYWLTSFIASDISDENKKELIKRINPLLKKQVKYTPYFDENIYYPLSKPILNDDYDEFIKNANLIKKSRLRTEKIKNILSLNFNSIK